MNLVSRAISDGNPHRCARIKHTQQQIIESEQWDIYKHQGLIREWLEVNETQVRIITHRSKSGAEDHKERGKTNVRHERRLTS